jgi:hypothetical protein
MTSRTTPGVPFDEETMMTSNQVLAGTSLPVNGSAAAGASSWIARIARGITTWVEAYEAAATYSQLSALSDAQLAHRGLTRATLAHDVRLACDRSGEV